MGVGVFWPASTTREGGTSSVLSDQATTPLEVPLSMMNQETYVNINDLHAQGWTISEIAEETGWHRTTVSKYLKDGPPSAARSTERSVMTDHWRTDRHDARVVAEAAGRVGAQQAPSVGLRGQLPAEADLRNTNAFEEANDAPRMRLLRPAPPTA